MPNSTDPIATAAQARARAIWRHVGPQRPPFAQAPGPGQESVWDYPRPPRLEADAREVLVMAGPVEIGRTRRVLRLLETATRRPSTCRPKMCRWPCFDRPKAHRSASGRARRATGRCLRASQAPFGARRSRRNEARCCRATLTCSARIGLQADAVRWARRVRLESPTSPPALSRVRERESCAAPSPARGRGLG